MLQPRPDICPKFPDRTAAILTQPNIRYKTYRAQLGSGDAKQESKLTNLVLAKPRRVCQTL